MCKGRLIVPITIKVDEATEALILEYVDLKKAEAKRAGFGKVTGSSLLRPILIDGLKAALHKARAQDAA